MNFVEAVLFAIILLIVIIGGGWLLAKGEEYFDKRWNYDPFKHGSLTAADDADGFPDADAVDIIATDEQQNQYYHAIGQLVMAKLSNDAIQRICVYVDECKQEHPYYQKIRTRLGRMHTHV